MGSNRKVKLLVTELIHGRDRDSKWSLMLHKIQQGGKTY